MSETSSYDSARVVQKLFAEHGNIFISKAAIQATVAKDGDALIAALTRIRRRFRAPVVVTGKGPVSA